MQTITTMEDLLTESQMKDLLKKIQRLQAMVLFKQLDLTFTVDVRHAVSRYRGYRNEAYITVAVNRCYNYGWVHFDFYQFVTMQENEKILDDLRKLVKEIIKSK